MKDRYPKFIKDVRGKGFMVGLEFHDLIATLPMVLRRRWTARRQAEGLAVSGFVGALLLRDYDILVGFTEYNRNVHPARAAADLRTRACRPVLDAFDDLLSRGIARIVKDFIKGYAAG